MSSIRIENLPDDLFRKLKASAAINHHSVEKEVVFCLEKIFLGERIKNMSGSEKAAVIIDQLGLSYKACDLKHYIDNCYG
ncbi:MAG: hypothetical protein H6681_06235 [Desulfobacteraceae bacterium]|nr:hypothetical protein [Desulfobacteraceae bacterium]MCB9495024.1 hypothetical protein [Desulfobacteraceae bacterium]